MYFPFCFILLLLSPVLSRNVPRYMDLEEEDQQLFRAAYDTPSYNHDEYYQEDDLHLGKLDLGKDGLWLVKAKLKELKAFDKALAANLLSTKLKVKELLKNHLLQLKKHPHWEVDKKPSHGYQTPSYGYQAPSHGYQIPSHEHQAPSHGYQTPNQEYQTQNYQAPAYQQYEPQYTAPAGPQYGQGHDPYYGH